MEGLKGAEAGTSSSSGSSSSLVVNGDLKNKQTDEFTENSLKMKVYEHENDDDENEHLEDGFSKFVPGPLLPLKEQLDKDKVAKWSRIHPHKRRGHNPHHSVRPRTFESEDSSSRIQIVKEKKLKSCSVFWSLFVVLAFSALFSGVDMVLHDQFDFTMQDLDDESLRRWKEKLLGCVESDLNGQKDPEVNFHSLGILSKDVGEITISLPVKESQSGRPLFTLREGVQYRLKLTFTVLHNIVSGLTCTSTVWKGGIQVDCFKGMLGTFAPQKDAYIEILDEETAPSGILARGIYTAKLRFEDDDKTCHLELDYSFEIKKNS